MACCLRTYKDFWLGIPHDALVDEIIWMVWYWRKVFVSEIWNNKGQLAYKVWLVGPIKNASFGSTTETPRKEESEMKIFSLICETNSKGQSFWMLPDSLGGAFGEINLGWNSKWCSCQTFLSTVQFWICLLSRKPGQALFEKHPLEGWRTFWLV